MLQHAAAQQIFPGDRWCLHADHFGNRRWGPLYPPPPSLPQEPWPEPPPGEPQIQIQAPLILAHLTLLCRVEHLCLCKGEGCNDIKSQIQAQLIFASLFASALHPLHLLSVYFSPAKWPVACCRLVDLSVSSFNRLTTACDNRTLQDAAAAGPPPAAAAVVHPVPAAPSSRPSTLAYVLGPWRLS